MAFKINPVGAIRQNELFVRLYLHHNYKGPNTNQAAIAAPVSPDGYRTAVANDWTMYEGPSSNTKLIARAIGMHLYAGKTQPNWQTYFSILFEDGRFKGSSLQVMGLSVGNGEWAIVGGTGELALAQGIIKKSFRQNTDGGEIVDLDIHAFYASPAVWTLGP